MQIRGWPFDGVFLESWPGFCPHGRVEGHARADRAKLCGILCKLWDICVLGEKWVSSVGKSRGRVIRTSVAKREGREGDKIAFVWSDPRARARRFNGFPVVARMCGYEARGWKLCIK